MKNPLDERALAQLFTEARTFNKFDGRPVSDETLRQLYDLLRWGPTAMNSQPGRYLFLRSPAAKERLKPFLMKSNIDKTMVAPVTVIVAIDSRFYEHITEQFPAYDARPMYEADAAAAQATATRNGTLQGAYLILAARSLGLDCGPMSGFDNARVDAEFFADGRYRSNFLINMGYGDPSGNYPRGPRLPFEKAAEIL